MNLLDNLVCTLYGICQVPSWLTMNLHHILKLTFSRVIISSPSFPLSFRSLVNYFYLLSHSKQCLNTMTDHLKFGDIVCIDGCSWKFNVESPAFYRVNSTVYFMVLALQTNMCMFHFVLIIESIDLINRS